MRHAITIGLALLTLALLAPRASADFLPPHCLRLLHESSGHDDAQLARDAVAMEACARRYMGVVPILRRAARGETVYRAVIHRGERSEPVFVEFVRPRHGAPWLNVRTDIAPHRGYVVPLSEAQFAAVEARWADEPAQQLQAKAAYELNYPANTDHGIETVCIGWSYELIEVVRGGNVTLQPVAGCEGWIFDFPNFLLKQAELASGACAVPTPETEEGYAIDPCLFRRPPQRAARSR